MKQYIIRDIGNAIYAVSVTIYFARAASLTARDGFHAILRIRDMVTKSADQDPAQKVHKTA